MPIKKFSILIGHAIETVIRSCVSTALVISVAFMVGFRPEANLVQWFMIVGILVLYIFMISWMSIFFGILAKSPEGASAFSIIAIVLPYLSSGFVPVNTMPHLLRVFSQN